MSVPTLSCYTSAFNVVRNGLDYQGFLNRALAFFDFVTIAINTSDDGTYDAFQDATILEPRVKLVTTDLSYTDVTFDGRVKDAALQACKGDVCVQMDADEYIPLNQRDLWREYAAKLLLSPVDSLMIPTVDLWGSADTIRANEGIGCKWRMHKRGLHRGVWKRAWIIPDKLFRIDMSDSSELLRADGELATAVATVPPQFLQPETHHMLNGYPFTVHTGYQSFDQRIRVNKAIWSDHWRLRNDGIDAKVALDTDTLRAYPVIRHQLNLI